MEAEVRHDPFFIEVPEIGKPGAPFRGLEDYTYGEGLQKNW